MKLFLVCLQAVQKQWYWVLLLATIMGARTYYKIYQEVPIYKSILVFDIANKSPSKNRQQQRANKKKYEEVRRFSNSAPFLIKLLSQPIINNGKIDSFANMIETNQFFQGRSKAEETNVTLPKSDFKRLNRSGNFQQVKIIRRAKRLFRLRIDPETDQLTLIASGNQPHIPPLIVNTVYDLLSDFYPNTLKVNQFSNQIAVLNKNLDSLGQEIDELEYKKAVKSDRLRNNYDPTASIAINNINRKLRYLNIDYSRTLKAYVKISTESVLKTESDDFFKVIDYPNPFPEPEYFHDKVWDTTYSFSKGGIIAILLILIQLGVSEVNKILKEAASLKEEELKAQKQ